MDGRAANLPFPLLLFRPSRPPSPFPSQPIRRSRFLSSQFCLRQGHSRLSTVLRFTQAGDPPRFMGLFGVEGQNSRGRDAAVFVLTEIELTAHSRSVVRPKSVESYHRPRIRGDSWILPKDHLTGSPRSGRWNGLLLVQLNSGLRRNLWSD